MANSGSYWVEPSRFLSILQLILSFHVLNFVEKQAPGSYEKARLRFAHAETVVPFTCLLGLFLEGSGKCF